MTERYSVINIPNKLICPACGQRTVQVRLHYELGQKHHLFNCYSGECPELPKLWSVTLKFGMMVWKRMQKKM